MKLDLDAKHKADYAAPRSVQKLHVGPCDKEEPTLEQMRARKTILRVPVT